jgi:hypothetical protein
VQLDLSSTSSALEQRRCSRTNRKTTPPRMAQKSSEKGVLAEQYLAAHK